MNLQANSKNGITVNWSRMGGVVSASGPHVAPCGLKNHTRQYFYQATGFS